MSDGPCVGCLAACALAGLALGLLLGPVSIPVLLVLCAWWTR